LDNKQFQHQEGRKAGYTIEEYLRIMEPVFRRQQAVVDQCIAGLTLHTGELRVTDSELEDWASECESLAETLEEQWQTEDASFNMEMGGI